MKRAAGCLAALLLAWGSVRGAPVRAEVAANAAEPMSFAIRRGEGCPQAGCITATGRVGADTAKDFQRFAKANAVRAGAVLELNSSGGDVVGAMQLGLMLRRQGLGTRVRATEGGRSDDPQGGRGVCASACAYVFVAGVRRELDDGARLGVHQFSAPEQTKDIWETQRMVGLICDYLDAVRADPKLERLALRTPPDTMHWLTSAEIEQMGLVTHGPHAGPSRPTLPPRRSATGPAGDRAEGRVPG